MDHRDLRTLKLLEEIEHNHAPSQRDLAKKLNISLGLVNAFVKRLAHKGYFKISTIPKNRVMYILTPKGMAEKTRLTYDYIHFSFQFYRKARTKLREILMKLEEEGGDSVIFYGAGELAEIGFISLQETNIRLIAVLDDQQAGGSFLGLTLEDPGAIRKYAFDKVIITDMETTSKKLKALLSRGIPRRKIAVLE
ncbi:MAG: winged helix-turn-helix transcriptional regulator [Deltaproteobacteria bacterium]|nr:winged helix-turn-helix transcriptional regulator [Deltaproteobacteria bacterium]MBW2043197.1 winged helix-turn-helix transcriptional regulator [Deltaproteobacteria bacterium]